MMTKRDIGNDELRERQLSRRAALLIAEGKKTDKEIARDLSVSLATLQTWKKSPLFQQVVETMGEEIHERSVQSIVDDIVSDAPTNLSFIKKVRDGDFTDHKDRMDIRLRASKMLFDKQAPNAESAISDGAVKLVIGGRLMGQMLRALKNSGVVEVDTVEGEAEPSITMIPERTPEDFAETFVQGPIARRDGTIIEDE